MSEEQQQEEQSQEQEQVAKPEWADDRFWDGEKGELRVEDIHKSWSHANEKLSGKKQAPEAYELGFSDDFDASMLEGLDSENALISSMMDIAKESDMSQEGFNNLLNTIVGSEIEELKAVEENRTQEMALLGDNGKQRVKDITLWLDATLGKEESDALKSLMNTAKSVEALEAIKSAAKGPSLKVDEDLTDGDTQSHDELRKRQFAKDDNGNRLMQNPNYAKQWREDAAAANFRA